MAYLKFSRDRRGYENFYLLQPSNRGKSRPRVLYWFRTPPGVKVGRSPFDSEMRRELEAKNPGVDFDWEAITSTPIPPPVEPERWRERRRVERAFRASSQAEESASVDAREPGPESETINLEPAEGPSQAGEPHALIEESEPAPGPLMASDLTSFNESTEPRAEVTSADPAPPQNRPGRRRRRRRGRRRPQGPQGPQGQAFPAPDSQLQPSQTEGLESPEPPVQVSGEPEEPQESEP